MEVATPRPLNPAKPLAAPSRPLDQLPLPNQRLRVRRSVLKTLLVALAQQTDVNGVRMESEAGGLVPRGTLDAAAGGGMAEQTLLAPGVTWRSAGFASRIGCQNPGEHSLELPPSLYELRRTSWLTLG